jgi:AcrR family transcriptional regulator
MNKRSIQASLTRHKILDAAEDLFYEWGFEKATIRDIAERVGTTKAAIYYHFSSKDEILYTIIEHFVNHLIFTLKSLRETDNLEALRQAVVVHTIVLKADRKGVKIVIEDKRFLPKDMKRLVDDKIMTVVHFYRDLLEELRQKDQIIDCDLTVAAFSIVGQISWLYHWYKPEKRLSIDEIAQNIAELVLRALTQKEEK